MSYHCHESISEKLFLSMQDAYQENDKHFIRALAMSKSGSRGNLPDNFSKMEGILRVSLFGFVFHIYKMVTDKCPNINSYISTLEFKCLLVKMSIYKCCLSQILYLYGLQEKHLRCLTKAFNI